MCQTVNLFELATQILKAVYMRNILTVTQIKVVPKTGLVCKGRLCRLVITHMISD